MMKHYKWALASIVGLLMFSCASFTPISLSSVDSNSGLTVVTKDISVSHGVRYSSDLHLIKMLTPEKNHIFVALEVAITTKAKTSFDLNNIALQTKSGILLVPALGRTANEPNSVLSKSQNGNAVPFVWVISGTNQFVLFYDVSLQDLPSAVVVFGKDSVMINLPENAYTTGAQIELN